MLYADGKVITPLFRAKPGDKKIDKTTGELLWQYRLPAAGYATPATYEIDGDQITIGPAAATRKLCNEPEGLMDQEQQFFEALGRARTFSLTPEKLELRDENGSLQVSFRVAEE